MNTNLFDWFFKKKNELLPRYRVHDDATHWNDQYFASPFQIRTMIHSKMIYFSFCSYNDDDD